MTNRTQRHIKDYEYWSVRLHGNQSYLGRCLIWCKRDGAFDLADCTKDEEAELFVIIRELKKVAEVIFSPDLFNYAFLGNLEPRHLHGHFLPRYETSREFAGVTFEDKRWGQNYLTDENFTVPDEVILGIVNAYRNELV